MVKALVVLMVIAIGLPAGADTIFLKDGRRIETPGTWEENGQIRYFQEGGIGPAIPKDQVERIETGQDGHSPAGPAVAGGYDLQQRLGAINTRNLVEAARNATVAIETVTGHGSGFFITADGFILTNRHVVEADTAKLNQIRADLAAKQKQLESLSRQLEEMKRHLASMEKAMAEDPKRYDHSSNRTVVDDTRKNVQAGQQQFDRRRAEWEAGQRDYRQLAGKKPSRAGSRSF